MNWRIATGLGVEGGVNIVNFRVAGRMGLLGWAIAISAMGSPALEVAAPAEHTQKLLACRKIRLTGEVSSGQEWDAAIGEGWLFRVMPIHTSAVATRGSGLADRGYTGWDLVIDRKDPKEAGGYPDTLLLGTPPYGSLNEREIGTTYGMRAQDAIAWEPRSFHFLTSVGEWKRARRLFRQVMPGPGAKDPANDTSMVRAQDAAGSQLLEIVSGSSLMGDGEFSVLQAKFTAGTADPPPFARQWALHLSQVPHDVEQSEGSSSPLGKLLWIRFAVTLRLPADWKLPQGVSSEVAKCAQ